MFLQKFFSLILFISILVQTMHKAVIVTGYYANPEIYARNCENKLRPQLHCNGKCQMMKKIKEVEKKEAEDFSRKGQSVDWAAPVADTDVAVNYSIITGLYQFYHCAALADLASGFFHPPGFTEV